jgi:hypothetical protein
LLQLLKPIRRPEGLRKKASGFGDAILGRQFIVRRKAIVFATDQGSILLVVYGAFVHAVSAGL